MRSNVIMEIGSPTKHPCRNNQGLKAINSEVVKQLIRLVEAVFIYFGLSTS